ncbi:MAG: methionine--tRNA ligase [Hydrogenophilales bacterium]
MRKILVTSALPYANGPIHLGHLVEYIQTDIWVRFQKLSGNEVHYICADDTHGTPIMLKAQDLNISPQELIQKSHQEHLQDFKSFGVDFSYYGSTDDIENKNLVYDIFEKLKQQNLIHIKEIEQFFDNVKNIFLPDRYIKGICPKCDAEDQYGDACEKCGSTYDAINLKNPVSTVTGTEPVKKKTEHYFFKLSSDKCASFLKEFIQSNVMQSEAKNKLAEWFKSGLNDWDISRDAPYFGFQIPGSENKFFYVWLDAPTGYLGTFKKYCKEKGIDFNEFINTDLNINNKTEMVHFIGKDILYFHGLFWPAILKFSGLKIPTNIFAHGFLTINGNKMSKSRGTFITAEKFLASSVDPDSLRYYYAAKLNPSMADIDLNLSDFVQRVNSDLLGKFVNIASRSHSFIKKYFSNTVLKIQQNDLTDILKNSQKEIKNLYEAREFSKCMKTIMGLADKINYYYDNNKPWELAKSETDRTKLHHVCSNTIHYFKILTIFLKPVIPSISKNAEVFLNSSNLGWNDLNEDNFYESFQINKYNHLFKRIDIKMIDKILDNQPSTQQKDEDKISIQDLKKIKLVVGQIITAEAIEDADKLLKLNVDLGNEDKRQVFAGIKSNYEPNSLINKLVIVVANLQPRKMRFGESQAMLLAASGEEGVFLLSPDSGAKPGMIVS